MASTISPSTRPALPPAPAAPEGVSVKALESEVSRLSGAARTANADGNAWLTKAEAAALPSEFQDDYASIRAQSPNHMVSLSQLQEAFGAYASRAARADADGDGIISAGEAKALPSALQDNFAALASTHTSGGKTGAEVAQALGEVAGKLTLTMFGEDDSGGAAEAVLAKGPFPKLDSGNVKDVLNQAFGKGKWKPEQMIFTDTYPPAKQSELWSLFTDYDPSASDAAAKAAAQFEGATLYAVTVDTRGAFSGTQYLVAQMADGSVVGLKGGVAGMTL